VDTVTVETDLARQLERRRTAAAATWDLSDEIVLVVAGDPVPLPGRGDPTYPFIAHSDYFYLTDRNRPGGVMAFDPAEGWFDFVVPVSEDERVWSGVPDGAVDGLDAAGLAGWLAARSRRRVAGLGAMLPGLAADAELTAQLEFGLRAVRRPKDAVEIERMREAERTTRAAFVAALGVIAPGVSERETQIELEAAARRSGADAMAYDTIVGGGPNAAVLHFPPSARRFASGELVLIDAGGEYRGYASDVTRTYPVGGRLSSEQAELHSLVRAAELAGIDRCAPGVEWREVHRTAALVIAGGLADLGLLRGTPEDLVASGAVSLFFPHGVGHLVGLGVRDAGGILFERRGDPPPYPNLRIDLPLEPGIVVTVEPGIYFIPALLQDPERRRRHRDAIAWDRVDAMLAFGGIRIEDNVLVTEAGHEVLSADVPLLG
jgi:Xaa-Pro aminopeptidase